MSSSFSLLAGGLWNLAQLGKAHAEPAHAAWYSTFYLVSEAKLQTRVIFRFMLLSVIRLGKVTAKAEGSEQDHSAPGA